MNEVDAIRLGRVILREVLESFPLIITWEECRRGQGVGPHADFGIGGPSVMFQREEPRFPRCTYGPELLELTGGHYFDNPAREGDEWVMNLRRTEERRPDDPFPIEVPCLSDEATWTSADGSIVVKQAYLRIWSLRRHYWKVGAEEAGAERAERDSFLDFADIGLRLDATGGEGPLPKEFRDWLANELEA